MAGIDNYRSNLRASVRGLWQGVLTTAQARSSFNATLGRDLERAWLEGADDCGITESELTQEELIARGDFIIAQIDFVSGFLADIVANNKTSGGKLTPLFKRTELWVNRYNEARNQSKTLACADEKGQWFIGPTEKHCKSCSGFDKRVYRFSVWESNGAIPQSQNLACNGFNCLCRIDPTSKRVTPGRFPSRLLG